MNTTATIIDQTKKWIARVVIGCNFCPFASRELKRNSIHYQVELSGDLAGCVQSFMNECIRLDKDEMIETTLLIFPNAFQSFDDYLDLLALAERELRKAGYEGIYQVASFIHYIVLLIPWKMMPLIIRIVPSIPCFIC